MTHHINTLNLTPMTPPTDVLTVLDGEGIFSGPLRRVALLIASEGVRSESAITWDTTSVEVARVADVTPRTFRNWVKLIRDERPRALEVRASNHGTTLVLHLSDRKWVGNGPETDRKWIGSGTDDATCAPASPRKNYPTDSPSGEVVATCEREVTTPPEDDLGDFIQQSLSTAGFRPAGSLALDRILTKVQKAILDPEARRAFIVETIAKIEAKRLGQHTVENALMNDWRGWLSLQQPPRADSNRAPQRFESEGYARHFDEAVAYGTRNAEHAGPSTAEEDEKLEYARLVYDTLVSEGVLGQDEPFDLEQLEEGGWIDDF